MEQYSRDQIWQQRWEEEDVFKWCNESSKPKYYMLEMFPYTSGRLHMGHVRNYAMGDALARMQRARGFNVLYPMGWDAFGLPAENAAIKHGRDPEEFTNASIESMKKAMKSIGFSYAWKNEITTCDKDYIAAQQRLFIKFYEAGLIYRDNSFVYWCDCSNTVLAAEQAAGGVCWRCGQAVTKKRANQWFMNIRKYADRLQDGLNKLKDWPASLIAIQKSWIGRNTGIEIEFKIENSDQELTVFTTRADTLAGCTFMAVAPEHKILDTLTEDNPQRDAALAFRNAVLIQAAEERANADKDGVDLGVRAINPLTKETIPIFVTNYVTNDYGTGAIMAVPGHDQRDFDFATLMNLPIRIVVKPAEEVATDFNDQLYTDDGVITGSGALNGMSSKAARNFLASEASPAPGIRHATSYRLQNWSISRQRMWGNPIPMVYCDNNCGIVPVADQDLPILLPKDVPSKGEGSPLSRVESFWKTTCPKCGGRARRDTDTMDTFVDSSWYYLRFLTPKAAEPINTELANRMLPVDTYVGGVEHATLHLIYARFITKVLRDLGYVNFEEPFNRVYNQGMVNDSTGRKQSKSLGNVVEPSDVIETYGADALRLYLLFRTTHNAPIDWDENGLRAASRYLERVKRLRKRVAADLNQHPTLKIPTSSHALNSFDERLCRRTHMTIQRVTDEIENFQFNTAIAALMELTNELYKFALSNEGNPVVAGAYRSLIALLNPFAPHVAEELWAEANGTSLLAKEEWPVFDAGALAIDTQTLAIQVNGKLVTDVALSKSLTEEEIFLNVTALDEVVNRLNGREPVRKIHVPGRIVNLVVPV